MVVDSNTICEYGHCGGTRRRETGKRWLAREVVTIGSRTWIVCEGCADLLLSKRRPAGVRVFRRMLEPGRKAGDSAASSKTMAVSKKGGRKPKASTRADEDDFATQRDLARVREIQEMRKVQSRKGGGRKKNRRQQRDGS